MKLEMVHETKWVDFYTVEMYSSDVFADSAKFTCLEKASLRAEKWVSGWEKNAAYITHERKPIKTVSWQPTA